MTLLECFDKHGCDKGSRRHRYDRFYEPIFEPVRNEQIRLLEIGIFRGASIAAWLDYFPNAQVTGVDTFQRVPHEEVPVLRHPRVASYWACDSTTFAPDIEKVDFIIDDGCHDPVAQVWTFQKYRHLLKECGVYFIEDVRTELGMGKAHVGAAGESLVVIR